MTEKEIVFGKNVLESLSVGMYSNPLTIYREYIQNATDALDMAIAVNLIKKDEALIHIKIDYKKRLISIKDNGTGVGKDQAYNILFDIANSQKDYRETRGFRGIGRLGALGCSKKLLFITSSFGEAVRTVVTWDCDELLRLLNRDNKEATTALDVMEKITRFEQTVEDANEHYFEVRLEDIYPDYDDLLDIDKVEYYLSTVAPVPFDAQKFCHVTQIHNKFESIGKPIDEYCILLNDRKKPIFKMYKTQVKTGHQQKTKKTDYVKGIEFFDERDTDGSLLYFGWYGITNFYGSICDPYMVGIRIRKGNILIGNEDTFSKFFKSEGDAANNWFLGEIYIYDRGIIPNAKRDDFERNDAYSRLEASLSKKADELNRKHRRLMSEYHSAERKIKELIEQVDKIEGELDQNGITSDARREKLLELQGTIETQLDKKAKELMRIVQKQDLEEPYKLDGQLTIEKAQETKKKAVQLENSIVNADYVTKNDLPTSYSKEERKLYQRIIGVIDTFFADDKETAENLRTKIRGELSVKKK